jgi:hypothetical protein
VQQHHRVEAEGSPPEPAEAGPTRGPLWTQGPDGHDGVPPSSESAKCTERFDLRPQPGELHCELEAGHTSQWHRHSSAGFEWCRRVLWLLPPRPAPRPTHAA